MSKFETVSELSQKVAKAIRMREWRIDKVVSQEELLPHIERIEQICSLTREYLKEMMLP